LNCWNCIVIVLAGIVDWTYCIVIVLLRSQLLIILFELYWSQNVRIGQPCLFEAPSSFI
jgi:hypothetical protein